MGIWLWGLASSQGKAQGDQTLTLELPPSQAALDARAAEQGRRATSQARTSVLPNALRGRGKTSSRQRGQYPSRGQARGERTVGRLGQTTLKVAIYRTPGMGSRPLTTAAEGTYLAIQEEQGDWYGVLMADGSTGWVLKQSVQIFNYEVVSDGSNTLPPGSDGEDTFPRGSVPIFGGDAQTLLQEAYKYLGVRYSWGGNTMGGIDCSGFVKNVFSSQGYRLPRTATEQMGYGVPVLPDQLQAGDRLYFGRRKDGSGVTHTGLYIGNGYFIHSSSSRKGVAISHLGEALYRRIFVCARR